MNVPFIDYVTLDEDVSLDPGKFPGILPLTQNLHYQFESPVTFFVSENGSGKSTLLEAMAVSSRLPISGGGLHDSGANHAFAEQSLLADAILLAFIIQSVAESLRDSAQASRREAATCYIPIWRSAKQRIFKLLCVCHHLAY